METTDMGLGGNESLHCIGVGIARVVTPRPEVARVSLI